MRYPVAISFENDVCQLTVPDVPGCKLAAVDVDEGMEKLEAKLKQDFALLAEYGESIPNAHSLQTHIQNAQGNSRRAPASAST